MATRRRIARGLAGICVLAAATAASTSLAAVPAGAAAASCSTISIPVLDATLGIDAKYVTAHHPAKPAGAVICSFYGATGRAKNEATVAFITATAREFAGIEQGNAAKHHVTVIHGIKNGAYAFSVAPDTYLYVLDGSHQLEIFAEVSLARLKHFATKLPRY